MATRISNRSRGRWRKYMDGTAIKLVVHGDEEDGQYDGEDDEERSKMKVYVRFDSEISRQGALEDCIK